MKISTFLIILFSAIFSFSAVAEAAPPYSLNTSLGRTSPTVTDQMGTGVAMSADGSLLFAGTSAGAIGGVQVYKKEASGDYAEEAFLVDPLANASSYLGTYALAVSDDGTILALGGTGQKVTAPPDNDSQGYVVIFKKTAGVWSKAQTITRASPGFLDSFGASVSLSADGTYLAAGASGARGPSGEAFQGLIETYKLNSGTGQYEHGQTIRSSDGAAGDNFGGAVSIASGGSRLAVSASGDNSSRGSVYVYTRSGDTWTGETRVERTTLTADGLGGFGALAMSADGTRFVTGAQYHDINGNVDQGSASVFTLSSGSWIEEVRLMDPAGVADAYGPYDVDISDDGREVALGFPYSGPAYPGGKVDLWKDSNGVWSSAQELAEDNLPLPEDADGAANDAIGYSLALASGGNDLLAGAPSAADASGNLLGRIVLWSDQTAPADPTITGAPSSPSGTDVSFEWTGDADATFECKIDSGSYESCTSPKSYTGLSDGSRTFHVRAKDAAGNISADADWTWTVAAPPDPPVISEVPATNPTASSVSFEWTGDAEAEFYCTMDSEAEELCSSPKIYNDLADGSHVFKVRAKKSGNFSDYDTHAFDVDALSPAVPTILSGPDGPTSDDTPSFAFSGDGDSVFRCFIDSNTPVTCTSPFVASTLSEGAHTFSVVAIDSLFNQSQAASRTFTVDITPPSSPVITAKPALFSNALSASFSFTGDPDATFVCELGTTGLGREDCTSPKTYSSLGSDGAKVFRVFSEDEAGNISSTATSSWILDTKKPVASFLQKPAKKTSSRKATFKFGSSEGNVTYTCKLDSRSGEVCGQIKHFRVKSGRHKLVVTATDRAKNTSAEITWRWTVTK